MIMDLRNTRRIDKARGTGLAPRAEMLASPLFPMPLTDMDEEARKRKKAGMVPTILSAGGGTETFGG